MSLRAHPGTALRPAYLTAALLATAVTLQLAPAALADLAPPTSAPKLARRTCTRYGIARTPAGPVARCLAHATQTLRPSRAHAARRGPSARSRPHAASVPAGREQARGTGTSRHTRTASGAARAGGEAGARGTRAPGGTSGSGVVVLAILAGTLVAAAVLALWLGAPIRRRRRGPHAAAS